MGQAKSKGTALTVQFVATPHQAALAVTQRIYCEAQWGHALCSHWSDPSPPPLIVPGSLPFTRTRTFEVLGLSGLPSPLTEDME